MKATVSFAKQGLKSISGISMRKAEAIFDADRPFPFASINERTHYDRLIHQAPYRKCTILYKYRHAEGDEAEKNRVLESAVLCTVIQNTASINIH